MPPNRFRSIPVDEFFQFFETMERNNKKNSSSYSLEKEFDRLVRRIQIPDKMDILNRHVDWRNPELESFSMYYIYKNSSWTWFLDMLATTHVVRETSRSLIAFCFLYDQALPSFKSLLSKHLDNKMIGSTDYMDEAGRLLSIRSHLNLKETVQLINSHQSIHSLLDDLGLGQRVKYDTSALPTPPSRYLSTPEPDSDIEYSNSCDSYVTNLSLPDSDSELQLPRWPGSHAFGCSKSSRSRTGDSVDSRILSSSGVSSGCDDVSSVYLNLFNLTDMADDSDTGPLGDDWDMMNNHEDEVKRWMESNNGIICQQDDTRSSDDESGHEEAMEHGNYQLEDQESLFCVEEGYDWDDLDLHQKSQVPSSPTSANSSHILETTSVITNVEKEGTSTHDYCVDLDRKSDVPDISRDMYVVYGLIFLVFFFVSFLAKTI